MTPPPELMQTLTNVGFAVLGGALVLAGQWAADAHRRGLERLRLARRSSERAHERQRDVRQTKETPRKAAPPPPPPRAPGAVPPKGAA